MPFDRLRDRRGMRELMDLCTELAIASGIEDKGVVAIAEPLQAAALMIAPGITISYGSKRIASHFPISDGERFARFWHPEGDIQFAPKHVALVIGDRRQVVEAPEVAFEHFDVVGRIVGLIGDEVHHVLIHVTDEQLDLRMPLEGIIDEFLNLVHRMYE